MLVTLLGIVIDGITVQFLKAYDGMILTLSPIFTVARLEQSLNIILDEEPAVVQEIAFQLTIVSPIHLENAEPPMLLTPLPIVTFLSLVQASNAILSMLVTLSGIVILVSFEQNSKASVPMLVTPFGIVMLVRLSQ